jgi:hypothetical protein
MGRHIVLRQGCRGHRDLLRVPDLYGGNDFHTANDKHGVHAQPSADGAPAAHSLWYSWRLLHLRKRI